MLAQAPPALAKKPLKDDFGAEILDIDLPTASDAELDGVVAGFCGVGASRAPVRAGLGELQTIAVDSPFWRRGVGSALSVRVPVAGQAGGSGVPASAQAACRAAPRATYSPGSGSSASRRQRAMRSMR